jgi:FkbM family methyltransferase
MNVTLSGESFRVVPDPFWEWAASGTWEPYTFATLAKYLPLHKTYLDVGAWIGPTALYASRFCNRIIAIEPDLVAYQTLRENAALNGNVIRAMYPVALMDYDGTVLLGSEEMGNSMTRLSAAHPGCAVAEVLCETISTFVDDLEVERPIFIKMDAEGAEEFILRDKAFFEKHKPTLYLSLHPQWFRNPGTAMETIDGIGKLYAHRHEISNNILLFTDL